MASRYGEVDIPLRSVLIREYLDIVSSFMRPSTGKAHIA